MLLLIIFLSDWGKRLAVFTGNPISILLLICEVIPLILGIIFWEKYKKTALIWFIFFLGYNFLNEILSGAYYVIGVGKNTSIFFNIRDVLYVLMYYLIYFNFLRKKGFRLCVIIFFLVWTISLVYFGFTSNFIEKYMFVPKMIGDFCLLVIILFSLIEVVESSKISKIADNLMVYLGLGLLISLVVKLPISIVTFVGWLKVTDTADPSVAFFQLIRNVGFGVSCIMYLIFAYGLYRAKRPEITAI
ncbi:hypothetical protein DSM03_101272 [Leeuwenhoekiella aestuarii]|uniref:Uncharacterized protein n=1 Tax=Leeuwenhoekiella aestuarii TaxID=2249426 RepID=A0A4Q0NSN9_9FLAO|nr:hypothetical protein [Leeuwenhoekiella aestuarii]RXG14155.1 hypothetical protein DSM04_104263 [Leeuwenhoekiella aestuarii]RXG18904.1 hypothetical protein DSM03_101272 [Leeuwenhoekiella aestuarii]